MKVQDELQAYANPEKAKLLSRYFKTGKGQYGEGDIFLGISVPDQRKIAKNNKDASLDEIKRLLESKIHEQRLTALLILVEQYQKTKDESLVTFYLKHTTFINNWDLVDLTAPRILGASLLNKDRKILYQLAKSNSLWEKRIAVIATATFIQKNQFEDTLKLAEILLNDKHDLMHKAVGWMLREVGKRNQEVEEEFLKKHYKEMPRTMLRYAIEKFDEKKRSFYLGKN